MKFADVLKFLVSSLFISILFYLSIYVNLTKHSATAPASGAIDDIIKAPEATISEAELARLIAKDPEVLEYYSFDEEGLNIYASPADKAIFNAECKIYYDEFEIFKTLFKNADTESLKIIYEKKGIQKLNLQQYKGYLPTNNKKYGELPLSGIRIALDPGHLGGDMETAMMEGKFVRIENTDGSITAFNEGNLAFNTAKILAKKLEAQGAKVFITKKKQGLSAFNITYDEWLKTSFLSELKKAFESEKISQQDYDLLKVSNDKKEIFELFFKRLDIEERARKINAFRPDLCLIIHYNVDEENYFERDKELQLLKPTRANYGMVFMPGAFLKNELAQVEERIELMRMLLTNDLAASLRFNTFIMRSIIEKLQVPPISPDSEMGYISRASVFTGIPGVFSRNLALTRMVHAPVCYTEPLCQDNEIEYKRLADGSRTKEVAEAYFEGIMQYFTNLAI